MSSRVLLVVSLLWLGPAAWALTVQEGRTAAAVSEQSCVAPKSVSVFQPVDRQAFVWFVALQVRAGDQLRVEWLDPSGAVSTTADYGELPNAANCVSPRSFRSPDSRPRRSPATGRCARCRMARWRFRANSPSRPTRQRRAGGDQRDLARQGLDRSGGGARDRLHGAGQELSAWLDGLDRAVQAARAGGRIWQACRRAIRRRINSPCTTRDCRPTNTGDRGESRWAHEPSDARF